MSPRPLDHLRAAAFSMLVLATTAGAQTAPAAPRRLAEVSLKAIPTTVTYRGRPVRVRYPEAPEVRALGGSGGPIIEVVITPPDGTAAFVWETQGIGLAVVESGSDWPAFEVWSNAGGGVYTRAVYDWRAKERTYCSDRVDDFEDYGDEVATANAVSLMGVGRFVRYARSRSLGCSPP
ncbi:MAG: hypothetical protein AB7N65_20810 [Vicinamibacterales bacterium]